MATPNLKPLDPSKPLPPINISRKRQLTGVICESPNCTSKTPHSTTYYKPKNQPNRPLIGISVRYDNITCGGPNQCPFGGYCRTYIRAIYHEALIKHNQQFIRQQKRKRDQTDQDYVFAMELQNLLNQQADADDAFPHFNSQYPPSANDAPREQPRSPVTPTPYPNAARITGQPQVSRNQAGTSLITGGQCGGVDGSTASGHLNRRNNACNAKACFDCCVKLNPNTHLCVPHSAQAKAKNKAKPPKPAAVKSTVTTTIDLTLTPTPPQPPASNNVHFAIPATQGGGNTYRRQCDQAYAFRTLAIKHQADERRQNEEIEKANNTVTIVVWGASNNHGGTSIESEIWREYIPSWPRFQLDQSQDLTEMVQRELGVISNQRLKVWSDAEQHWIGLRLSILETYPEDCRRILIMFPSLQESQCKGLDQQLALVNIALHKPDIRLDTLGHSDPGCPPIIELLTESTAPEATTPPTSPIRNRSYSSSATPELPTEGPPSPPPLADRADNTPNVNPSEHAETIGTKTPKWPTNVSMQRMLKFLELTTGDYKISIPSAWNQLFGGEGMTYVPSTASLYRRWMDNCKRHELVAFVSAHPKSVVQDGLNQFDHVWKQIRKEVAAKKAEAAKAAESGDKAGESGPGKASAVKHKSKRPKLVT
ncbi:uncharacterized protein MELLADRAFT_113905 [Melampsora larici-populina 98AG31]|uniref:Uncharacterized protein n=1 Tax=Melampsora larici-populina (strain 98AG31 / pathotype 3-4-7) TaxID=747676 RepID=F4SBE7_MELLP|nr:uncharacterized protein MELLADRAFT_113905 [Melampsora larici-populina 98AG31]EGF98030.1 hypothetical protein MELLADRAFT_113905 [Melampsora larici-populina 98AG31]